MKILLIGNSYTHCHQMPEMLTQMVRASGQDDAFTTTFAAPGGWYLKTHWEEGDARPLLARGGWDVVMLQEQSLGTIEYTQQFFDYAKRFHEVIQAISAKTFFYLTWARQHTPSMIGDIASAYTSSATECGAGLSPVGLAWARVVREHPDITLYVEDESHPTEAGSYLAACTHFASLLKHSPEGSPHRFDLADGVVIDLPKEVAARLQHVAWQTVEATRHPA